MSFSMNSFGCKGSEPDTPVNCDNLDFEIRNLDCISSIFNFSYGGYNLLSPPPGYTPVILNKIGSIMRWENYILHGGSLVYHPHVINS